MRAYKMFVRGAGALDMSINDELEKFPLRAFAMLGCNGEAIAQELLDACEDMLDEFSAWLRAEFPTVDELMSDECLQLLCVIGVLLRLDTVPVERLHANFRAFLKSAGRSSKRKFKQVLSDVVVSTMSTQERGLHAADKRKRARRRIKPRRKKTTRKK